MSTGPGGASGATASTRVVLWRHGRTEWNAQRRFQGQTDVALDDVGRQQAARAAAMLAALQPHAIVSSDLARAADTAAALARLTGLPVRPDAGLRETYAGRWQGLTLPEIRERFPEEAAAWHADDVAARPGGGETRLEVAERVVAAVERALTEVPADGMLVAVTHGGAARVALCRLLGLPTSAWGALGGLSNCCWSVLARRELPGRPDGRRWRLVEHNAGTLPEPVLTLEG